MQKINFSRRKFLIRAGVGALISAVLPKIGMPEPGNKIIKPPRLQKGDKVGLIAPASCAFEPATIREGIETLQNLGFEVKEGKHIGEKYGYLAGSDEHRVADLHEMFADDSVRAIFALRGGYGSMRLLDLIDYELIKSHPKIFVGYSDITSLLLAIHGKTGMVTFHGPVAISSFSEYTQNYFWKAVSSTDAIGEVTLPKPDNPLRPTAHLSTIKGGKVRGRLIGGNLTLLTALMGTPYEPDYEGAILFLEETGEEPYDIDRMLTQLLLSKKLDQVKGIIFDLCPDCEPRDYKPAFPVNLSLEEVLRDRLGKLNCPVLFGMKVGHEADKPTMPLGITVTLDADKKTFYFEESAVS